MPTKHIRLDTELVEQARSIGVLHGRSIRKQLEHWARIGQILEDNPDMPYALVSKLLEARSEITAGKYTEYEFG